jgi:hypothetical protein
MATRKPKAAVAEPVPLPSLTDLPDVPMAHDMLHRIVNAYAGGTGVTALAKKFNLPLPYVKGVIHHYLTRYE